ncbi:hypothetical protein SeLEV6574_g07661, partial [Synchytrium endobioticum]
AVTCQTHSIPLVINGHEERVELPVFDSTEYDMILGLDWLMKHNPRSDWNTHSLIFSDPNLNVCVNMVTNLHATTPAVTNDELYQLPPSSWPMSEFPKVFDMKEQMQLPKQREEWDFDVKFKENEPLPRLLKRYIEAEDGERRKAPPPLKLNYEEGFMIEEILDVRRRGRGFEYLIAWEGFGPEDRTLEPRTSLNDDAMLRRWHQSHPEKPSPFALRN